MVVVVVTSWPLAIHYHWPIHLFHCVHLTHIILLSVHVPTPHTQYYLLTYTVSFMQYRKHIACIHMCIHMYTHRDTRVHKQVHKWSCTGGHTRMHICTHMHTHTTHARITHTHTPHTHAHTHTPHTHASHTHTPHTPWLDCSSGLQWLPGALWHLSCFLR